MGAGKERGGSEKIPLLNGFRRATALFLPSGHGCLNPTAEATVARAAIALKIHINIYQLHSVVRTVAVNASWTLKVCYHI